MSPAARTYGSPAKEAQMSGDRAGFAAPAAIDAGFIVDRKPQPVDRAALPPGLTLVSADNADRVMWAQDYPHSEGAFGFTGTALQEVLDAVSEADARLVLGDTASALYKLS
jgi:hypothetical protein